MLTSNYTDLGSVTLPVWRGRQKYMHTFDARRPVMAEGYEDYAEVARTLCERARHAGIVHMTVDEKIIEPGMSQRRPGAHVDGYYHPALTSWGSPPGKGPGWNHFCNNLPVPRMAVIVAASVAGCIAYPGEFDAEPRNDGDLEHIRPQLGDGVLLPAEQAFLLSPDCVHESVRFTVPTKRTFLRIALQAA